jgi:HEAT repeat protein
LASATLSDGLLHSVVWFSGAALVLMVLMVVNILRLRLRLIARKRHERQFMRVWQPLLAAAVSGERGDLPPLPREDLILFLKLWNHLHESVRGHARRQLNIMALRLDILPQLSPLLFDRNRGLKLLALTTLGNLQAHDDWATIREFCDDPDPLLSWTAAHALFQVDGRAALRELQPQLVERLDWPAAHLIVLLKESASDEMYTALANTAARIAASVDAHDLPRVTRLLQVLQSAPYNLVIPAVRRILAHTQDDEVLAQCLKFLREPEDIGHVRAHVHHANWVVRLQVAQALGRFGAEEDIPRLALLLRDPVWWVRYRSAQALMALTHGDAQVLTALRKNMNDRFALDMLAMVHAEKGRA